MSNRDQAPILIAVLIQTLCLLLFLNVNIRLAGEMGGGLWYLVAFYLASIIIFCCDGVKVRLVDLVVTVFFCLLVYWIVFRVVVDTQDYYFLRQVTVGTTGGIIIFYSMGIGFVGGLRYFCDARWFFLAGGCVLLIYFALSVSLLNEFVARGVDESIFAAAGVDGDYQRPGNFITISVIVVSYLFYRLNLSSKAFGSSILPAILFAIYTLSIAVILPITQLIGSNSALVAVFGVYAITASMALAVPRRHADCLKLFSQRHPIVHIIGSAVKSGLIVIIASFCIGLVFIYLTGFDVSRIRFLGYGAWEMSSVSSRLDILATSGLDQIGHSPFFGDINVAREVTGDAATTLHSLFPHLVATFGIFGLMWFLAFLGAVACRASLGIRRFEGPVSAYVTVLDYLLLGFILVFANMATDIFWPVLWVVLGIVGGQTISMRRKVVDALVCRCAKG
jgi:hypothetical protein